MCVGRFLFFAIGALIYSSEVVEGGSNVPIVVDLSIPLARIIGLGSFISVQQTGEENKIVTVTARGADIGGTDDSFGFFSRQQNVTDIVATMHHEKMVGTNRNSKGGLMMRAKLTPDSPHVSLLVHAGSGVTMYSRATTGGPTTRKNVGVWVEDLELKLDKTGNTVSCFYKHSSSPDWYHLDDATAEFNWCVGEYQTDTECQPVYYVGHAVTSAADNDATVDLIAGEVEITHE
eukprot:CAMPEP_0181120288 /NCGR_PEP_ID=MMETSP1071-20121207/24075_1 /TAXON_ID=35127 /ORGANISM="Thalassiosira sp., Strain NH16" /LENGTH=232 /DNA_ID=CAMNT_0023204931 /DNA_START=64 /DNA_END=762 /DNA_ORIENTATION=-